MAVSVLLDFGQSYSYTTSAVSVSLSYLEGAPNGAAPHTLEAGHLNSPVDGLTPALVGSAHRMHSSGEHVTTL